MNHPDTQAFLDVLEEMRALHLAKQQDYGRADAPFANVEASRDFGIDPWVGAMVRLNDKVRRLQSYTHNGSLANEGVTDSLIDIAVYAAIALVLWRKQANA